MTTIFQDPIKQEVWNTLLALNDCWTTAKGNPEDLKNYFHKNIVAITPTDIKRLEGREACVSGWVGFAKAATIYRWEELEPKIDVFGNAAVVTYYFDMSFTMGGQRIELKGRDMFFFVKESERWWVVADQYSPSPG